MIRRSRIYFALAAALVVGAACGGLPFGGDEAALAERPPESPFTFGLVSSWLALTMGGSAAVMGIWVDRDRKRPVFFALAMSLLIATAMCVGGLQGFLDEEQGIETRADLERMLDMVEDIAASSGDPELAKLVEKQADRRRPRPGAPKERAGGGAREGKAAKGPAAPDAAPPPAPGSHGDGAGKAGKGDKARSGGE